MRFSPGPRDLFLHTTCGCFQPLLSIWCALPAYEQQANLPLCLGLRPKPWLPFQCERPTRNTSDLVVALFNAYTQGHQTHTSIPLTRLPPSLSLFHLSRPSVLPAAKRRPLLSVSRNAACSQVRCDPDLSRLLLFAGMMKSVTGAHYCCASASPNIAS